MGVPAWRFEGNERKYLEEVLSSGFRAGSDGAFTFMVKASHLPSGDQVRLEGDFSNCEMTAVSPLSIHRTWICWEPVSLEIKASLSPFGDQRGDLTLSSPE